MSIGVAFPRLVVRIVEPQPDNGRVDLAKRGKGSPHVNLAGLPALHDEDIARDLLGKDGGVGDEIDRRRIDDYIVKMLPRVV